MNDKNGKEMTPYQYKEDKVTKWFLKRGLDFSHAVRVRNSLAAICGVIFILYVVFGNVWMDDLREGTETSGTQENSAESMTLEERMQSLQEQREGVPEPKELSPAKKAAIFLIRAGLILLAVILLYMLHISNCLWVLCLIYGPIFLMVCFQAFGRGSLGFYIMLVLGVISTAAGILLLRPQCRRFKEEKRRTG